MALNGDVDMAIVGSVMVRGDLTETQLIAAITGVRQRLAAKGINIPIVTCDVHGTFLTHPNLVQATDIVLANIYPYWEGCDERCARAYLDQAYQKLMQVVGTKQVVGPCDAFSQKNHNTVKVERKAYDKK